MVWIILLTAPAVLGLLWGAALGRRDYFSIGVMLVAPLFSGGLIVGVLGLFYVNENVNNPNHTWQSLAATIVVYGSAYMVAGAIPTVVGSSAAQFAKLCLFRRASP